VSKIAFECHLPDDGDGVDSGLGRPGVDAGLLAHLGNLGTSELSA